MGRVCSWLHWLLFSKTRLFSKTHLLLKNHLFSKINLISKVTWFQKTHLFSKPICFKNPDVLKNRYVLKPIHYLFPCQISNYTCYCTKNLCSHKPICFYVRTLTVVEYKFDSKEIDYYFTNILEISMWKARIRERNCTSLGWGLRMFDVIAQGGTFLCQLPWQLVINIWQVKFIALKLHRKLLRLYLQIHLQIKYNNLL